MIVMSSRDASGVGLDRSAVVMVAKGGIVCAGGRYPVIVSTMLMRRGMGV